MTEKIHTMPDEHVYKGMTMPGVISADILERLPNFEFRPDDVLVSTYPKSGTVWLSEIVWLIQHDADIERSRRETFKQRSPFLEFKAVNAHMGFDAVADLPSPRTLKSHQHYSTFKDAIENPSRPNFKIVVGMRNVRDMLVSLFHFYKMNAALGNFDKDFAAFFELFKQRRLIVGDYFDQILSWWAHRDNPNIHFVKYEDLKRNPKGEYTKIANFLGKNLTEKQMDAILHETSFNEMQNNPMTNGADAPQALKSQISKLIRKGIVGDWQNFFNEEQVEYVNERCKIELDPVGLKFDYLPADASM